MSSYGIKCAACGCVNNLGRVFCSNCGQRLDLRRVTRRVLARAAESPSQRIHRAVRALVLLVIAVILGLILWPVEPAGKVGKADEVGSLKMKIQRLERAVLAGAYVFDTVTEGEINAYLEELLKANPEISKSSGLRLGVQKIRVWITPDRVVITMIATLGPLQLSYELRGLPTSRAGQFFIQVEEGRFGHLWLPGPLAEWIGYKMAHAFSEFRRERKLLSELTRFDLGDGKVRLVTRPKRLR